MSSAKVYATSPLTQGPYVVQDVLSLETARDQRRVMGRLRHWARGLTGTNTGWSLGEVTYTAEVVPLPGVIPAGRLHPMDGASVTAAGLDALLSELESTGLSWVVVASADVIIHDSRKFQGWDTVNA